jgi:hypothetical protein
MENFQKTIFELESINFLQTIIAQPRSDTFYKHVLCHNIIANRQATHSGLRINFFF